MKRRELEKALLVLETTPLLLARVEGISPVLARQTRVEGVSLRDRMWALALIEKDVWNLRIRRLLTESSPRLGEIQEPELFLRASRIEGEHREALRVFGVFRGQNVRLLRQVSGSDWERAGTLPPDRRIVLRDVPSAMAKMDERHQSRLLQALPSAETRRQPGSAALAGCCG
jgi:hypothetical protein